MVINDIVITVITVIYDKLTTIVNPTMVINGLHLWLLISYLCGIIR